MRILTIAVAVSAGIPNMKELLVSHHAKHLEFLNNCAIRWVCDSSKYLPTSHGSQYFECLPPSGISHGWMKSAAPRSSAVCNQTVIYVIKCRIGDIPEYIDSIVQLWLYTPYKQDITLAHQGSNHQYEILFGIQEVIDHALIFWSLQRL